MLLFFVTRSGAVVPYRKKHSKSKEIPRNPIEGMTEEGGQPEASLHCVPRSSSQIASLAYHRGLQPARTASRSS